jgi:hypothetical protein
MRFRSACAAASGISYRNREVRFRPEQTTTVPAYAAAAACRKLRYVLVNLRSQILDAACAHR